MATIFDPLIQRTLVVQVDLQRKGVTLTLLWEEYRAAHEGRRTWGRLSGRPVDLSLASGPIMSRRLRGWF